MDSFCIARIRLATLLVVLLLIKYCVDSVTTLMNMMPGRVRTLPLCRKLENITNMKKKPIYYIDSGIVCFDPPPVLSPSSSSTAWDGRLTNRLRMANLPFRI